MEKLIGMKCEACEGGVLPLTRDEINNFLSQLSTSWEVINDKKIKKEFSFKDFLEAMDFVNKVAKIAEEEGHHPDIYIFYNKVNIELSTHAIGGLSKNDFILAAKIEEIKRT